MSERFMDPDDLRPVYLRIADELRQAYQPGVQLPPAPKVAEDWGVAKETVRSALDVLRKEGLIVSWQGRGTFYRVRTDDQEKGDPIPTHPLILERLEDIMTRLEAIETRMTELEQTRER